MTKLFSWLGQGFLLPLQYFLDILLKTYLVIKSTLLENRKGKRLPLHTTSLQVYFTGVQALMIIALAGLVAGSAVIVELATILPKFGAGKYVERLAILVLVRELAPIITAFIIIGRSGTAMATELGNMKLNREIELLESLGINIDYFLVLPRLLGTVVAILCLSVIFNAIALGGGFLVANFLASVSRSFIFADLISAINYSDIIMSLLKVFIFGWIIAIVNCVQGLSVKRSFTEVPQVTTKGVVNSIILCFIASIFVSLYIFPEFNI
ncbi:MAG: ABC transporter permease [Planctomycetota bacterium]|nr:ABC transporter permease [Planctomycetota bacterium]MDI6788025.1 ABC transporter permease [Planctomycetota bacterium]